MKNRPITSQEKNCIVDCIHKFWNVPDNMEIKNRDVRYERCLENCEICDS